MPPLGYRYRHGAQRKLTSVTSTDTDTGSRTGVPSGLRTYTRRRVGTMIPSNSRYPDGSAPQWRYPGCRRCSPAAAAARPHRRSRSATGCAPRPCRGRSRAAGARSARSPAGPSVDAALPTTAVHSLGCVARARNHPGQHPGRRPGRPGHPRRLDHAGRLKIGFGTDEVVGSACLVRVTAPGPPDPL